MNNALNLLRTTFIRTPLMHQSLRPFTSMYSVQPAMTTDLSLFMMNENLNQTQLECKKNKATKQAQRKRNKRKTGAQINVRFK